MNLLQNLLFRLRLRRITRQDIALGIQQKDIALLQLGILEGAYPVRIAAVLGLGQLKARNTIPVLIPLLFDDYENVAKAAQKSLQAFLPDAGLERQLEKARTFWIYKREKRRKRKAVWYNKNNPLDPTPPLIDRSQLKMLAKIKLLLQKPIRWG
ncbi:MAG: HEAT repeat domain-containing protein [Sinomicrobium sp.]|nr:HEAT repeat domain-containing protein [Sinomicrobium sp.]